MNKKIMSLGLAGCLLILGSSAALAYDMLNQEGIVGNTKIERSLPQEETKRLSLKSTADLEEPAVLSENNEIDENGTVENAKYYAPVKASNEETENTETDNETVAAAAPAVIEETAEETPVQTESTESAKRIESGIEVDAQVFTASDIYPEATAENSNINEVAGTGAPVIYSAAKIVCLNETLNLLENVQAHDANGNDLTGSITVNSNIPTENGTANVPGVYQVTYSVQDSNGKSSQRTVEVRVLTERSSKIFECVKNFGTSAFIDIDASDDMHQIVNQYKEEIKGSYYSGILTGFRGAVTTDVYGYSQLEIMPQYLHSANDEATVDEFVNRTANEIMSSCHTEADRIKAAHDAITANAKYFDCENMSHSPVSIVENGTGVCQAYSLLNQKLLEAMGINSQYVDRIWDTS